MWNHVHGFIIEVLKALYFNKSEQWKFIDISFIVEEITFVVKGIPVLETELRYCTDDIKNCSIESTGLHKTTDRKLTLLEVMNCYIIYDKIHNYLCNKKLVQESFVLHGHMFYVNRRKRD